jgi:hypothetical protein
MLHTINKIEKFINQELVELMPDGSPSIENSQTKSLIKFVADLVADEEFSSNHILSESLIEKLKYFDPTFKGFKFSENILSSKNRLNFSNLNEMHSFYKLLTRINKPLRLLIDWCCLTKNIHKKANQVIQKYN